MPTTAASTCAYEIHPGEDLHDGVQFEMFLDRVKNHPRANMLYDPSHYVLQHLDYLDHIDIYHDRIKMFHVKDAELNPTGRQGVYGGFQSWVNRAGRFRSPGDGQVDFGGIFSKLTQYGFDGWAVVEWECCLKHPEDGAREGAAFVEAHIIRVTEKAFDDFAGAGTDRAANRKHAWTGVSHGHHRRPHRPRPPASALAWSAADAVPSSAPSTASPRGLMTSMNWLRALSPPTPNTRPPPQPILAWPAPIAASPRWPRAKPAARTASTPSPSSPRTTCTPPSRWQFLKRGIHVICDKPLTATLPEAKKLAKAAEASGVVFALTHNYTGYPMIRQAKAMIAAGDLGDLRLVNVEYVAGLAGRTGRETGQKQADWRTDPARSGAGGSTGDIGTHAFNLANFVSGLTLDTLAADLQSFVPGPPRR